jgi:hypothetical protein
MFFRLDPYYALKHFWTGEVTMHTTIQGASEILGISEKEILEKLGLPASFSTDSKLIDIEDEYEDITWAFIRVTLVE